MSRYHWARKSYRGHPSFLRPLPPTPLLEIQVREISGTYGISFRQAPSEWGSPRVPAARQDFPGVSQNTDPDTKSKRVSNKPGPMYAREYVVTSGPTIDENSASFACSLSTRQKTTSLLGVECRNLSVSRLGTNHRREYLPVPSTTFDMQFVRALWWAQCRC